jgi:hypothetical protein
MRSKTSSEKAGVMAEFDQLQQILAETHDQYPALLECRLDLDRRLGQAEIRNQDSEGLVNQLRQNQAGKEAALRRRAAAADGVVELEGRLRAEKNQFEAERQRIAAEVIAEYEQRCRQKVEELMGVYCEGEALQQAFGCKISMPIPAKLVPSLTGGLPTIERVRGNSTAMIDRRVMELAEQIERVGRALVRVANIKRDRDDEVRSSRLAMQRGQPTGQQGIYRVISPVGCLVDGLDFRPGQLVDEHILSPGYLAKLIQSIKFLRPVAAETSHVAA